jgi:hypothetical protein
MADFTTEADVRLKFQLVDTTLVPTTLIEAAIDDAHEEVLRYLDSSVDTEPPDEALVLGETLLAGVHLFRSLASKDAFDQKHVSIGGQRLEGGGRFAALTAIAERTEVQAWYMLEPYLEELPPRKCAGVTATEPVLGDE